MIIANEKTYAGLHHLAMLLPAAGVFLFNALSVKTSSLLLAISAMDPEIIGKVRALVWKIRLIAFHRKHHHLRPDFAPLRLMLRLHEL